MAAPMQFVYIILSLITSGVIGIKYTENDLQNYRNRVKEMFYHAYDKYIEYAYPYDELRPLSCDGIDTWGSFSLTLIDALDTLALLGNFTEFQRVAKLITEKSQFDININVSVFETNIRVIGGLLSAHLLSKKAGMELEDGWPCSGPLLRLAESVGRRLLPAFDTPTKMPYGTVNLRHGVPSNETPVTCTACVTSYIVEFGTLSRLTGDPVFENAAMTALMNMWKSKSKINLVGNHINVVTGAWTAIDSGIGAGIDSYYEYLVKGAILFQKPELLEMFKEYRKAIDKYMLKDDWYMWVNMNRGSVTMPLFQSLEAYWPGVLSLVGDIQAGLKSLHNYHQIWKQYGFTPEFYNIPLSEAHVNREGYPLRPELIESIMYLYRATKDPLLLQMGVDILESIQHSARTHCGYATIKDVRDHKIEDKMESFFLAETIKYLYLLFDTENFIHGNGSSGTVFQTTNGHCILDVNTYVFNTEAHPIDISAVHCCSSQKKRDDKLLGLFEENIDLLSAYGLKKRSDFLKVFRNKHVRKRKNVVVTDEEGLVENENVVLQTDVPELKSGEIETSKTKIWEQEIKKFEEKVRASTEGEKKGEKKSSSEANETDVLEVFQNLPKHRASEAQLTPPRKGEKTVNKSRPRNMLVGEISESTKTFLQTLDQNSSNLSGDSEISMNSTIFGENVDKTVPQTNTDVKSKTESVETSKLESLKDMENGILEEEQERLEAEKENLRKWAKTKPKFKNDYSILSCPVQSFLLRFSLLGETFNVD
uniref:alpha-1,2-Mannosidase n=1 Tax=Strigamia maritima TaxID=126957 RepID=T1IZX8_STRMM